MIHDFQAARQLLGFIAVLLLLSVILALLGWAFAGASVAMDLFVPFATLAIGIIPVLPVLIFPSVLVDEDDKKVDAKRTAVFLLMMLSVLPALGLGVYLSSFAVGLDIGELERLLLDYIAIAGSIILGQSLVAAFWVLFTRFGSTMRAIRAALREMSGSKSN